MRTLRTAIAGILALLAVAPAAAQLPNIQDRAVWGRIGSPASDGGSGPSQSIPFTTLFPAMGGFPPGTSVNNPGTGVLESLVPVQTNIANKAACTASCAFTTSDLFMRTRRSNSGSAMSDTLPAAGTTGLINGTRLQIANVDATASDTITAGSGTTILGASSFVLGPSRDLLLTYDLANTAWRSEANTGTPIQPVLYGGTGAATFTAHGVVLGEGTSPFSNTAALTDGQLVVGQTGADPLPKTVSGDWTLSAAGAATLATVNANVGTFGSATSCVTVTNNAKGLTTAISATTCTPAIGSISGLGTGIAAALANNTGSAGAPVLFNGAGGAPSSLTLTNATGCPLSTCVTGTLLAAQFPALTGDVTTSAGALATTIAANAVTNAKMAAMAANTVKANATGGSATPTDVTAATARSSSLLNVDSFTGHGDSIYTILATDRTVGTNAAFTASRTWTLPAANAVNAGQEIIVADYQGTVGATNTLVITRAGSDTVNGGTSVTMTAANGAYLFKSDGTSKWSAQALGAAAGGGVSSVTCGTGLSGGTITTSGTCAVSLTTATTVLGSDVAMNNTANYFDGPSMAQGTSGTWWVSGTVTVTDTAGVAQIQCKLWDGTTVISSSDVTTNGANNLGTISLSGFLVTPAANIKISCKDLTATTGKILFNQTGNSKDSAIFGHRIG